MNEQTIYHQPITAKRILLFTFPTILMTLIQSSYSMIDGIFISNIMGDMALSSLTLISPYFNFFIAIAAMFASGGSAIVMRKMGEKKEREARQDFTSLLLTNLAIGGLLTILTIMFTNSLVEVFHASKTVTSFCKEYLFIYSFFIIPQLLFSNLQVYTIASGASNRAMFASIFGGIFNIVFDFLLIKTFHMGMTGAAIASGFGMLIPCLMLGYRFIGKKSLLHLVCPKFRLPIIMKTITNGFSEFSSNLVSGIVMLLFNSRMLHYAGENGVAASTITFYVFGLMSALYMGYMFGISPLLSYFYGANKTKKMKKIRKISLSFIFIIASATTFLSITGSNMLVRIFTNSNSPAYHLAVNGNRLFSLSLLLVGFNTFSSMLFTALSNGKVSSIIAFSRSFIFLVATIIILPIMFGINGLWLAVPTSELLALGLSIFFFKKYQNQYQY